MTNEDSARGYSLRRQNRFRSRCPSPQILERARQAPARGRHRPVCRGEGRVLPLHRRSVCRAGIHPRAGVRRGAVCDRRRRLRRPVDGRAAARGGFRRPAHHRERRRRRRHLVLESLSRRDVRRGILLLPAAARRARLHAEAQVFVRAGDPRAQPAHRAALPPLRQRAVPDRRSPSCAGTRTTSAGSSAPIAATASRRSM